MKTLFFLIAVLTVISSPVLADEINQSEQCGSITDNDGSQLVSSGNSADINIPTDGQDADQAN